MLKRLEEHCERGEFYEAQFQFKTIYARHLSQKNFSKAVEFQCSGVETLLRFKQNTYAVELAGQVQELYAKSDDLPLIAKSLQSLSRVFKQHGDSSDDIRFLSDFLSFLRSRGKVVSKPGDISCVLSAAHYELALSQWRARSFRESQVHFLNTTLCEALEDPGDECSSVCGKATRRCCRATQLAEMLCEWYVAELQAQDQGGVELALLLCRTNLLLLCCSQAPKVDESKALLADLPVVLERKLGRRDVASQPLFHFMELATTAVAKKCYPLLRKVCEVYSACIKLDPSFAQAIDRIKQVHFGIQPPTSGLDGIFSVLQSLM
eukprot:RCo035879